MALQPGTQLGAYKILRPLGAGGMGEVYRAIDTRLNRDVAIKVLSATFANDEDRLRRFEQEARATSALNHPNILTVYDIGTHEGAPYIVAELLEGEELRAQLNDGPLAPRKAIDYAHQIAAGLAAAHGKGIIHRDLKPENLFITIDGRVKILDFGLAKLRPQRVESVGSGVATQKAITDAGVVLGTVGYMAPEQKSNERFGRVSPDGNWLAYQSDESGGNEIYVTQFPQPARSWRISTSGGVNPHWRGDGKELFFVSGNKLMAVSIGSVSGGGEFQFGTPQPLFEIEGTSYAPSGDGKRFLSSVVTERAPTPPINVVLNWATAVKK